MNRAREGLEAVINLLKSSDTPFRVTRGRHYKVRFTACGRPTHMTVSVSPSDNRMLKNSVSRLRRLLRGGV